jgi:hypothetical protein
MYKLVWPTVTRAQLIEEASQFFRVDAQRLELAYQEYAAICKKYGHAKLGELKTLNTDETFIIFLMLKFYRPTSFIEVGTLLGRSTRRFIDIKKELKLSFNIDCYDVVNKVKHFSPSEAKLILHDLTGNVTETLEKYPKPGHIYLDAHPYYLTTEVIRYVLNNPGWTLVIHDSGKALCNPNMTISKDNPAAITSLSGHWERYCLAEVFNISGPFDPTLDNVETSTHKMRIFTTKHGICAVVPK